MNTLGIMAVLLIGTALGRGVAAEDIDIRRGGSLWARVESDGWIRIDGSLVGRFEDDGAVRKDGSLVGKIEASGDIRIDGSLAGAIEADGTLRKAGSIIGAIERDGTIRKGGSIWGAASPCCSDHDELKTIAAILVFFAGDFFEDRSPSAPQARI